LKTIMAERESILSRGGGWRKLNQLLWLDVSLVALVNGLRANEARECISRWCEDRDRIHTITALKTKGRSVRKCYIPSIISNYELSLMCKILPIDNPELFRRRFYNYLRYNFDINPHQLRRMFIDYMLGMGFTPEEVKAMLGMMRVKTLKYYAGEYHLAMIKMVERLEEQLRRLFKPKE